MAALLSLLFIIVASYLAVRAGAIALTLTGLSPESASFQAQSAFMGVGFTTSESESVVAHPARRRVIRILMLLGYLSLGSGFAGVFSAFNIQTDQDWLTRIFFLLGGIVLIFLATRLKIVRDGTTRILESVLVRIGQASVHDYDELLRVNKGFAISSLLVEKDNWMIRRSLRELRLTDEGVIILNISRGEGLIIATPGPETLIEPGDKLLLYGLDEKLAALAARTVREGAVQHEVERKQHLVRKQAEESARAELAGVEETLRYSEASDSQEP